MVLMGTGLLLMVGLALYGIKMTHKVAGPLFKVSLYLAKMRDGRFDKVYNLASLTSAPLKDVQTITVPPGGAVAVDMKLEVPGEYVLVDHALSRVGKGAAAALHVTGPADSSVYQPLDVAGGMHDH